MAMVKLECWWQQPLQLWFFLNMAVPMEVEVGILLVPAFRVNDWDRRGVNIVLSPLPKM